MTEFPIERRNLLQATGVGVFGTGVSTQVSGEESASDSDVIWLSDASDTVECTVTGVVSDNNGNPLTGADIELVRAGTEKTEMTASTNGNGEYTTNVPAGTTYEITAGKKEYGPEMKSITANENHTYTINFTLPTSGNTTGTWPMFQYGPGNTGVALNGTGPSNTANVNWVYESNEDGAVAPVADSNRIYAAVGTNRSGDAGKVIAISIADGEIIWENILDRPIGCSPAIVNETLYVGTHSEKSNNGRDGRLYAFEATTGNELWRIDPVGGVSGSPTVVDDTVYFGTKGNDSGILQGTAFAVDSSNGQELWKTALGWGTFSAPAVDENHVYVEARAEHQPFYALDKTDGATVWEYLMPDFEGNGTVTDGTVYITGFRDDKRVVALDSQTGNQEWEITPQAEVKTSPAIDKNTLCFGTTDGVLFAVNKNTGSEKWSVDIENTVVNSPAIAGNLVYFPDHTGKIHGFDLSSGDKQWEYQVSQDYISAPIVADGMLVVADGSGAIYTLTESSNPAGTLSGQVTDGADNSLADVTLEFVPAGADTPEQTTTTNDSGNYEVELPADTTYEVTASKSGFVSETVEVTVEQNTTQTVDFTLSGSEPLTAQNGVAIDEQAGIGYVLEDSMVVKFDLASRERIDSYQAPDGTDQGLAYGAGSLWYSDAATDAYDGQILELAPDTGAVRSEINTGYDPYGVAYGDGSLWVAEVTGVPNNVYEFSPDGTQIGSFDIGGPAGSKGPQGLAYYNGSVWVGTNSALYELGPNGGVVQEINEHNGGYKGIAGTSTALYGPDGDGNLTVILGNENPNPTGTIAGTVENSDDQPIDAGTAYLIDPVYEEAVIDYVAGEESLPNTEAEEAISDGTFSFDSVSTGPHLVVVDPPDPFDSRYMDVSVQVGETATALFTVSAERYLAPLDSNFDELTAAAEGAIERSTADLAPVYVDGAQLFGDDLDEGDFLPSLLDTTAFAFGLASGGAIPISTQIANFVAGNTAIPLAEHGHNQLLEQKITEVEGTEFKQDLGSYASACVETDWITSLDKRDAVPIAEDGFKGTPMYQTALESIDSAVEEYDNIALEEPADDFSFVEVQSVLTEQVRWLKDNGISPGVLITPQGTGYVTREARYHAGHYDTVRTNFDATDALDKASTGLFIAGKGATIVGAAGGVTAAVGAVIAAVGAVGDFVFSMFKVHLKNKLGNAWVDTLMYWLSDLDDAATLLFELAGWIQSEAETPTLQHVDGNIDSTDLGGTELNGTTYALANRPDYPFWWPFTAPKPLWRRQGTHTVSVTNTGDVETEFQMIAVDTYGDDGSGGVSDAVSMYPQDSSEGESSTLEPAESAEVEFEYNSNFHPFNPFNWHYMSTALWMNGKAVDEVQDPYYIVPSFDLLPLVDADGSTLDPEEALSQGELQVPIHTKEYMLTDASTSPREAMTVDDWTDNVGEITLLEEGTVDPEQQTLSFEYQTPTDVRGVVFLLTSPMGAELNLSVENNAGQYVGYDPNQDAAVVEIPTAEYNGSNSKLERIGIAEAGGSYQVEATGVRFLTADQASVSVYAAEVPERDASLAVSPGRMDVSVKPGGVASTTLEIAEAGNQVGMDVTDVSVGPFKTPNGATLTDVDISFSETSLSLSAGEETSIELTVDANSSIDLPDGPVTRFQSELIVETTNAGTAVLEASVLVFETDVEGAELTQAGPDVEGVSLTTTDQLPKEPPEDVLVTDQYEIEVVGTGGVSLSFPRRESPDTEIVTAYQVEDNGWSELETSAGDRLAVDLPASGVTIIAVTTVQIAPSALPGYENSPQDLDGDGLFEDVDGDGEFTIFDVQAFFTNFQSETVQSNPAAFNFTEEDPEEVTIFDVQALFRKLS